MGLEKKEGNKKNATEIEKRKSKKQGMFMYLNPKNLVKEVNRYGYHFSLMGFWKFYILAFIAVILVSLLYGLQLPYVLVIVLFSLFISPFIILNTYKNMYEQKRFLDVTSYLEQLLYSFRKVPKILNSLEDTLAVFPEGKMNEMILLTMNNIQTKPIEEGTDIYHNAFKEMEEHYGCRRMKQIHDFLIKVEDVGGDFNKAIDILLEDRRLWIERVYELEAERKNLKVKIIISLALSFLICGLTMLMLPKDFNTLQNALSQFATTTLIISNIAIYYFAQKKLGADWLNDLYENTNEIERHYNTVVNWDAKKERKKSLIKVAIGGIICAIGIMLISMPAIVIGGIVVLFSFMQPSLKLKTSKKRILREIDKAFPIWIMELSLLLQTDNPQVSLTKSVEKAPFVLQKDLSKLVDNIEKNPADIKPYISFMPEFDLPDVQSALRMLYSMSETGVKDAEEQIMFLVERNNRLLDKSERMSNEDSIAGIGLFTLIPMVTGSIKMMVDLGVFLISLLNMTQNM